MKLLNLNLLLIFALFTASNAHAGPTIIGGSLVNANSALGKRTVGLILFSLNEKNEQVAGLCSGEIIDQTHILTAAHCIEGFTQGYIAFTTNDIIEAYKNRSPAIRKIATAKMMPGYDPKAPADDAEFPDFAILTFKGGLPTGYEPAHFLTQTQYFQKLTLGTKTTLSGYGVTSVDETKQTIGVLQQVEVKIVAFTQNLIDLFVEGPQDHIACSGDSGGPAVATVDQVEYVIGVASRSDCQSFSIYSVVTQEMVNQFLAI